MKLQQTEYSAYFNKYVGEIKNVIYMVDKINLFLENLTCFWLTKINL